MRSISNKRKSPASGPGWCSDAAAQAGRRRGCGSSPSTALLLAAVLGAVLAMASCSSRATVLLSEDLSGRADVELSISPALTEYYRDITGDYSVTSLISREATEAQLALRPGISLESYADDGGGRTVMGIRFDDINRLVRAEAGDDSISLIERSRLDGGRTRLRLLVNRRTVPALLSLGPVSSNILSDYLLPPPGSTVDARTYRDDLVWALGDYGPAAEIEALIDGSALRLVIVLPRPPLSLTGGRILNSRERANLPVDAPYAVEFVLEMVEVLTLSTPGDFSVIY
jgi:hypothetical protein